MLCSPPGFKKEGHDAGYAFGCLEPFLGGPGTAVDEDALVGPSQVFEVEMIMEDESTGAPFNAGFKSDVLVADFSNDMLNYLREYDPVTESTEGIQSFHEVHPSAIPAAQDLLAQVLSWAVKQPAESIFTALEKSQLQRGRKLQRRHRPNG